MDNQMNSNNKGYYYEDETYGIVNETAQDTRRIIDRKKRTIIGVLSGIFSVIVILSVVFAVYSTTSLFKANKDQSMGEYDISGREIVSFVSDKAESVNAIRLSAVDSGLFSEALAAGNYDTVAEQGIELTTLVDPFLIGYYTEVVAPSGPEFAFINAIGDTSAERLAADEVAKRKICVRDGKVFGLEPGIAQLNIWAQDGKVCLASPIFFIGDVRTITFVNYEKDATHENNKEITRVVKKNVDGNIQTYETSTIEVIESCSIDYMASVFGNTGGYYTLPAISQVQADTVYNLGYSFQDSWTIISGDERGNGFTTATSVPEDTVVCADWDAIDFTFDENQVITYTYGDFAGCELVDRVDALIDALVYNSGETKYFGDYEFKFYYENELTEDDERVALPTPYSYTGAGSLRDVNRASAHEYKPTVTITDKNNGVTHDFEVKIDISKKKIKYKYKFNTDEEVPSKVYDGDPIEDPEITIEGLLPGDELEPTIVYYPKDDPTNPLPEKPKDADEYIIKLEYPEDPENYEPDDGPVEIPFVIYKKPIDIKWHSEDSIVDSLLEPISYIYNATERTAIAYIPDGQLCKDDVCTIDQEQVTYDDTVRNAGVYEAALADGEGVLSNSNYELKEEEYTTPVEITRASLTIKIDNITEQFGKIIKGQEFTSTNSQIAVYGSIDSKEDLNVEELASSLYVSVTLKKDILTDSDYEAEDTETLPLIEYAKVNTYTDALFFDVTADDVRTYCIDQGYDAIANYDVILIGGDLVITKATVAVEWTVIPYTYDGNGYKPSAKFTMFSGKSIDLTVNDEQIDAGSYTASAVTETYKNYTLSNTTCDFTITKRDVSVVWSSEELTYNGKEQSHSATIDLVSRDGGAGQSLTVNGKKINAGTGYTATADVSASKYKNYNVSEVSNNFDIKKKKIPVVWGDNEFVYNGDEQVPEAYIELVSRDGGKTTLVVSDPKVDANSVKTPKYPASVDVTKYEDNYIITDQTNDFTISKKEVEVIWSDLKLIYNGKKQTPTAKFPLAKGGYQNLRVDGAQTDARTGYSASVEDAVTPYTNYTINGVKNKFDINPKEVVAVWSSATFVYNTQYQAPTAKFRMVNGVDQDLIVTIKDTNEVMEDIEEEYRGIYAYDKYVAQAKIDPEADYKSNYIVTNTEKAFVIAKRPVEVEWGVYTFTYDRSSHVPTAQVTFLESPEPVVLEVTGAKIDAGDKYIANVVEEHYPNYNITNSAHNFVINKAPATITWYDYDLTYNAKSQRPKANFSCTYTDEYYPNIQDIEGAKINAGTGYWANVDTVGAYKNYQVSNATFQYTIKKAKANIVWGTTEFTYNGYKQSPTAYFMLVTGAKENLTVTGSKKDAGDGYPASVSITKYTNYEFAENSNKTTFNIAKKKVTVTWTNWKDLVYNGGYQKPNAKFTRVAGEGGADQVLTVSGEKINKGEYEASVQGDLYSNYILLGITHTFNIIPKPVVIDWGETVFTYNGEEQVPTASFRLISGNKETLVVTEAKINAGENYPALAITEAYTNYSFTNPTNTFDINRLQLEIIWDDLEYTYNGYEQSPIPSYIPLGAKEPIVLSVYSKEIDAGNNYTAAADISGIPISDNYEITNDTKLYDIKPAPAKVIWGEIKDEEDELVYNEMSDIQFTYNALPQKPNAWFKDVFDENNDLTENVVGEKTDAGTGYLVNVTIDDSNYIFDESSKSTTFTINKLKVTIEWEDLEFTYDGKSHIPTAKFKDVFETYKTLTVVGKQTNAQKDYVASCENAIKDPSLSNYEFTGETEKFTIKPMEIEIVWSNLIKTFNGMQQKPTARYLNENKVQKTPTIEVAATDGIHKGEYDATASVSSSNYTIKEGTETTKFTVNPKEVPATWDSDSFVYDGASQYPGATYTDIDGNLQVVTIDETEDHIDVNDYDSPYVANGSISDEDYKLITIYATHNYSITPATVEVIWGDKTFTFDGKEQKPTASYNLLTGGSQELAVEGGEINAGTDYTAFADFKTDDTHSKNYNLTETDAKFVINPKVVDPIWTDTEFTYDGKTHIPTATYIDVNDEEQGLIVNGEKTDAVESGKQFEAVASITDTNYVLSDPKGYFVINPKPVDAVWGKLTFEYNMFEQKPTAYFVDVSNIQQPLDVSGEQTNVNVAPTKYTATASLDDPNYVLGNTTANFDITPREVKITWTKTSLTYTGTAQKPVAKYKNLSSTDVTLTVTGEKTDVGTYTASTTITDPNYKIKADSSYTIDGDYAKKEFTIKPYELKINNIYESMISKQFDNTDTFNVSTFVKDTHYTIGAGVNGESPVVQATEAKFNDSTIAASKVEVTFALTDAAVNKNYLLKYGINPAAKSIKVSYSAQITPVKNEPSVTINDEVMGQGTIAEERYIDLDYTETITLAYTEIDASRLFGAKVETDGFCLYEVSDTKTTTFSQEMKIGEITFYAKTLAVAYDIFDGDINIGSSEEERYFMLVCPYIGYDDDMDGSLEIYFDSILIRVQAE